MENPFELLLNHIQDLKAMVATMQERIDQMDHEKEYPDLMNTKAAGEYLADKTGREKPYTSKWIRDLAEAGTLESAKGQNGRVYIFRESLDRYATPLFSNL